MEDITNIFSSRLKNLRGNRNQDDVAKELGISRASLSYYETGARKPDINTLYALAITMSVLIIFLGYRKHLPLE